MKRQFVKSQLPKELEGLDGIVDSIMDAHGAGVEAEKAKTTAATEKADKLQAKLKEADDKLSKLGDESETEKELAILKEVVRGFSSWAMNQIKRSQ